MLREEGTKKLAGGGSGGGYCKQPGPCLVMTVGGPSLVGPQKNGSWMPKAAKRRPAIGLPVVPSCRCVFRTLLIISLDSLLVWVPGAIERNDEA